MKTTALFKRPVSDWYSTTLKVTDFTEDAIIDYALLYPTQDELEDYLLMEKVCDSSKYSDILVVCVGAKYIMANGHHTAASRVLNGQRLLPVRLHTITRQKPLK